ncbi:hypothetical protein GCM10022240_19720 [Microbacterium kribbense]|uniref:Uncharacterized protein n=1 Tax=Microbacterium kribbense TaxID=433645 RepID=A0ABP7GNC4_9MICO
MDLLHNYSKQSRRLHDPRDLSSRADMSRRLSASDAVLKRRARQLRVEEVNALIANYRDSGSVVAAANALGITRQTAAKHLAAAGIATVRRMTEADLAAAAWVYGEMKHGPLRWRAARDADRPDRCQRAVPG